MHNPPTIWINRPPEPGSAGKHEPSRKVWSIFTSWIRTKNHHIPGATEFNRARIPGHHHDHRHVPDRDPFRDPFRVRGRAPDLGRDLFPSRYLHCFRRSADHRTASWRSVNLDIFLGRDPYRAPGLRVLFCLLQAFPFSLTKDDLPWLFTDRPCRVVHRDPCPVRAPCRGLRACRSCPIQPILFRRRRPRHELPNHGRGRPPSFDEPRPGYVPPWLATRSSSLQLVRGKDLPDPPDASPQARRIPGKPLLGCAWAPRRA